MAGEALVLGMILSVTVLEPRYRGPYILLTGIGVFITLSRGGILTWVIAVAGLMLARGISPKDLVLPGFLVCRAGNLSRAASVGPPSHNMGEGGRAQ